MFNFNSLELSMQKSIKQFSKENTWWLYTAKTCNKIEHILLTKIRVALRR
jgi:hypothetical protein